MTTSEDKRTLTFYRGISVTPDEADQVRQKILDNGMSGTESRHWQFACSDLRPQIEMLFQKDNLSTHDTRPERNNKGDRNDHPTEDEFPVVCACGDEIGAAYYAAVHNQEQKEQHTIPLLIEFTARMPDVHIDGRDFLYNPAFQSGKTEGQRRLLWQLFGVAVDRYFVKAMRSDNLQVRLALCDLAVQDPQVVASHATNRIVIGGRHGTKFCSAFFVRLPIAPDQITSVRRPTLALPSAEVSVERFLRS